VVVQSMALFIIIITVFTMVNRGNSKVEPQRTDLQKKAFFRQFFLIDLAGLPILAKI